MKIIAAILIVLVSFSASLAHDTNRDALMTMAWDMFSSSRICLEAYDGETVGHLKDRMEMLETCIKVQNTCHTIYHALSEDENRKWLSEGDAVKKYFTSRGLEPIDYCHMLKLMSLEQKKPKE